MSRVLTYKVVFEPAEEGGYTVYVPSLPGCISEGAVSYTHLTLPTICSV